MISEINDIHTHVSTLKSAIHNVLPTEFKPNPGFYYSVGIHPWYIDSYSREQWKLLESAACHVQVLAIGESGLDNLRGPGKNEQIVHFEKHIRISEELAKEKGIKNGDEIRVWNNRGSIKAFAMVTVRYQPLEINGKKTHTIGLIHHWSWASAYATGDTMNDLSPNVGDPNSYIPEYKAFLVNVEKAK